jgi:hypothetical protein
MARHIPAGSRPHRRLSGKGACVGSVQRVDFEADEIGADPHSRALVRLS